MPNNHRTIGCILWTSTPRGFREQIETNDWTREMLFTVKHITVFAPLDHDLLC